MVNTIDTGILFLIFAVGLIAGFLLTRYSSKQSSDTQSLKKKLEELRVEHHGYQESVNSHFTRTADLIDSMNRNYKEIQTHLMQGAELLVNPDYRLEINGEETDSDVDTDESAPINAPRDWAPKEPDQEGTLSENYGLKVDDLVENEDLEK